MKRYDVYDDFIALKQILNDTLAAHQRAEWGKPKARQLIIKVILNKFKKYLEHHGNKEESA